MNPLLMLLFLLWSGFALADPASLPDELAEEAGIWEAYSVMGGRFSIPKVPLTSPSHR